MRFDRQSRMAVLLDDSARIERTHQRWMLVFDAGDNPAALHHNFLESGTGHRSFIGVATPSLPGDLSSAVGDVLAMSLLLGGEPEPVCPAFAQDSARWEAELARARALGLLPWSDSSVVATKPGGSRVPAPDQEEWDLALGSGRSLSQVKVPFVPSAGPVRDLELVLLWNDVENFGFVPTNCTRRFQCAALQKILEARGVTLRVCRTKEELRRRSQDGFGVIPAKDGKRP